MPAPRVIIELSPSRVEVALLKGDAVEQWKPERFDRAEWPVPPTQAAAIADVGPILTRLVNELGPSKAHATVIYTVPGAVANLTSCAASIGSAAAEQAAVLALSNTADFPVDDAPIDTFALLTDTAEPADGSWSPQKHMLVMADAEQRVASVVEMVSSAGLEVDRLIPADAVAMMHVVGKATEKRDSTTVVAALWIGEHSSMLAVGVPGRLMFVRPVAGGTEALVDALTRTLRPRDPEAAPVNLKHHEARTLLLAAGVPAPDAEVPGHPELAGSALLPHLQPLLQRLSVEIKQSIRFGVSETDRPRVQIMTLGPGAAVPGLPQSISRLSGFPLFVGESVGDPDALDSSTGGLINVLAHAPTFTPALMSEAVRQVARRRTLRKALAGGVVVAGAFIALQYFDAVGARDQARRTLAELRSQSQAQEGPAAIRQQVFAARQAVSAAEARVVNLLGSAPDAAALLAEVSARTPETVRIASVDLSRDQASGSTAKLHLRGYVRLSDAADAAQAIKSFVDSLTGSPIIETVKLGATQRMTMRGFESQTFDLTIGVVSLPPLSLLPEQPKPAPATPTPTQASVPTEAP